MQGAALEEGWIQLSTHRAVQGMATKASDTNRRKSTAAIIATGAALCLVVAAAMVGRNQSGSADVLFTKSTFGKDPELATINQALALEITSAKQHAGKGDSTMKEGSGLHGRAHVQSKFSEQLREVQAHYSKEIKAAKIQTMQELQEEEHNALNAVHRIKDNGKAEVDKLMTAEKKSEKVILAKQEEKKLSEQLAQVEKDAEERKAMIEAKMNAVRTEEGAVGTTLSNLKVSEPPTQKAAPAVQHKPATGKPSEVSKEDHVKDRTSSQVTHAADESQIKELVNEVAALHAKKMAVRAKVDQVEQQQNIDQSSKQNLLRSTDNSTPKRSTGASLSKRAGPKCTANNCDIQTEDKSEVTNGESIHKLSEALDADGSESQKEQALEQVKALQDEIRADYKHVQDFAYHQEHELDAVKKRTVSELGHEVMLAVESTMKHEAHQAMVLKDSAASGQKM